MVSGCAFGCAPERAHPSSRTPRRRNSRAASARRRARRARPGSRHRRRPRHATGARPDPSLPAAAPPPPRLHPQQRLRHAQDEVRRTGAIGTACASAASDAYRYWKLACLPVVAKVLRVEAAGLVWLSLKRGEGRLFAKPWLSGGSELSSSLRHGIIVDVKGCATCMVPICRQAGEVVAHPGPNGNTA